MIDGGRLYTGPLTAAAAVGTVGKPIDTGEHTVILLGLAFDCTRFADKPIKVRMEMTPEDAEDTARSLLLMARSARSRTK
jgi:hypothetical protein